MKINRAIGYMLLSVLGFALMNLTVKFLHRLPTTEIVLFRSVVSLVLSIYFLRRQNVSLWGNNRKFLILRGVCGVMALTMFFYTLQRLPLGSAITLQYLSPIFTAVFGMMLLGEKVRPWQWIFFLISFAGTAVIKGFDPRITPLLFASGVGSALFAGLAYVFVRRVKDTDHPLVVVFYFPLVATPVMLVVSLFSWTTPQGWEWLLLLVMGIFTQIAQVSMTKALQAAEVNEIVNLKYLGIIFALGFDFLLFDESHSLPALIGIIMVLGGVLLNVLFKVHQRRRAAIRQSDASE